MMQPHLDAEAQPTPQAATSAAKPPRLDALALPAPAIPAPPPVWRLFVRNRLAALGFVVLMLLLLMALFAPLLAPADPDAVSYDIMAPPSSEHWLGTDDVGRDMLSRLMYAARVSLAVGILSSVLAVTIGVALGAVAGFFGGMTDTATSSFTNIMLSIPLFPLALVLGSFIDTDLTFIVLIIGFLSWMSVARIVRAETLSLREREFSQAAVAIGASPNRIILRHILPNTLPAIIVAATLGVASAILLESSLSYLGYGIQPPTASWGNMLQNAQRFLRTAPGLAFYPGLLISLTVISINFVGDGLRDALDPRLRL